MAGSLRSDPPSVNRAMIKERRFTTAVIPSSAVTNLPPLMGNGRYIVAALQLNHLGRFLCRPYWPRSSRSNTSSGVVSKFKTVNAVPPAWFRPERHRRDIYSMVAEQCLRSADDAGPGQNSPSTSTTPCRRARLHRAAVPIHDPWRRPENAPATETVCLPPTARRSFQGDPV